jgi:DNA polymerase V
MAPLDAANARFGRGALRSSAPETARPWGTRRGRMSPRFTTRVDELMEAKAW